MPEGSVTVEGYDFNNGVDYHKILQSYLRTGYQATNFGRAVEELNRMRKWRLSDEPIKDGEDEDLLDPEVRKNTKCKIFFGYTSNLISSGTRESIRYLVEHKMVDVIVTTAGGIEEDFIKCLAPTYLGDFKLDGATLRKKGINRIGNLLVPNDNYVKFEDWMKPILDAMLKESQEDGVVWTPSKMIHRLGKEINDPRSVYYWAYKNNIPVYSPALTDGSIGDMIYFHSFNNPGLVLDIAGDIRAMNDEAANHKGRTGMFVLGGGLVKHHIHNANLMRNGADYAVIVSVAQEFDGSDAGASPDEAKSWGKIRSDASPVKLVAEASLVLPLLIAETFARKEDEAVDN
jgi:deoxyhypusine synthase